MTTVGSMAVVLTASATDFERTMGRAARSVKSTEKEFMRSARQMERIGRRWTMAFTVPIVAGFTVVTKAAIEWEDAFAGVRKTVSATEKQFTGLDKSLRKMTERIPLAHQELAGIAETAGQLGIQVENIEDFTEVMAMLGTATNMASSEAAIALAQMANVMQTGQQSFDRLGATVVHLGNNLATMESNIVEFGQRIAGAGKIAGLTEAQVLAVGGAFASVGVNAEAGGTAVSKVLQAMTEAVATGNKNLQGFAAVSGMSAVEFATAWREDAGIAFTRFVEGLGASGDQAFAILRNLGLTDQRLLRGFLSVSGAGDLLRKSIEMGTQAWEENVALVNEANERYKTRASRLRMLGNRAKNVAISFGGALAPMFELAMDKVETLVGGLQRLAEWFEHLPRPIRIVTGNLLLMVAVIGPAALAMGLLNKAIAAIMGMMVIVQGFIANAAFAFAAWRGGAASLGQALVYLVGGPVKAVILGIGVLIAAVLILAANWDKLSGYAVAAWNVISAATMYGASLVVRGIGLILTAIGTVAPSVRSAAQAVMGLADSLKASAGQSMASAKSAASAAKTAAEAAKSQEDISEAGKSAADTQEELADSIAGVGAAAKANLQSFDEVHQLQDSMSSAAPTLDGLELPEIDIPEMPSLGGGIVSGIGDRLAKAADTAVSAWGRVTGVVKTFAGTIMDRFPAARTLVEGIGKAVGWVRENWSTIGPVIEGVVGIVLAIMNPWLAIALSIAAVAYLIVEHWDKIKPVLQGIWDNVKKIAVPIWEQLKKTVVQVAQSVWATIKANWNRLKTFWDNWGAAILAITGGVWGQIGIIIETAIRIVGDIIGFTLAIIRGDWEKAWFYIKDVGFAVWDFLVMTWTNLVQTLTGLWIVIKNKALEIWEQIKAAIMVPIQVAWAWLKETWNTISNYLADTWDNIKNMAKNAWDGVKSVIKGAINGIIGFINRFIQAWNKIELKVPKVTIPLVGTVGGWTVSVPKIPEIPMLQTGTNYVPQDMYAYLHKGEAVVPREFNPTAISGKDDAAEIALAVYRAIIDAIRMARASQTNEQGDLVLKIDGTVLARLQLPALMSEAKRQGINLDLQGV